MGVDRRGEGRGKAWRVLADARGKSMYGVVWQLQDGIDDGDWGLGIGNWEY